MPQSLFLFDCLQKVTHKISLICSVSEDFRKIPVSDLRTCIYSYLIFPELENTKVIGIWIIPQMIFLPIWTDYIFLIAALFNRNRRVKTPDSVNTMITSFQAIIPLRIDSIQCENRASLVAQMVKRLPTMREIRVQSLGWEDPLEKEMATHSSILAWKISWMEPGRLQSSGSRRFGQDWATSLHFNVITGLPRWR